MTAHSHDPEAHGGEVPAPNSVGITAAVPERPRWLVPGILIALVVGGLVVAGAVSLSTVLSAGLVGGMLLMHLGGHGHAGHAGHAARSSRASEAEDLSPRSCASQPSHPGSIARLGERAVDDSAPSETETHDQHHAHARN